MCGIRKRACGLSCARRIPRPIRIWRCLQAGLDGIKHKILPPVCADCAPSDRAEGCGDAVRELPDTLIEALQEMKGDPLIRAALGEYAYAKYSGLKKKEWDRYKAQVSAWELEQYLSRY